MEICKNVLEKINMRSYYRPTGDDTSVFYASLPYKWPVMRFEIERPYFKNNYWTVGRKGYRMKREVMSPFMMAIDKIIKGF
jgi:hypothetical protein